MDAVTVDFVCGWVSGLVGRRAWGETWVLGGVGGIGGFQDGLAGLVCFCFY